MHKENENANAISSNPRSPLATTAGPRCLIYENPSAFLTSRPPLAPANGEWGAGPYPAASRFRQTARRAPANRPGLPSGLSQPPLRRLLGKGGREGSLICVHIAAGFMN